MRRLLILLVASVLAPGALPAPAWADLFVSSLNTVPRYDAGTGASLGTFVTAGSGGLSLPQGLVFGPDGNLYVASFLTNQVLRYNGTTGAFIDVFVAAGSGGLSNPEVLHFGPDGNLYVASFGTNKEVLRYNGTTGAFLDIFVAAGSGGLTSPSSLVFGPDGNLYVASFDNSEVLRYNGTTGTFIDIFAAGSGLSGPIDLVFGPDGNLYVTSGATAEVLRYNGTTGFFIDIFAAGSGLSVPAGLVFGPDGNLYVASAASNQVLRYNGTTGAFLDIFVAAVPGGLILPSFLVFRSIPVPTLSEWGMILLALSLLALGTWQVTGRSALLGVATTAGGALLRIPARPLLRSVLVGQLMAALGLTVYGQLIAPVAVHDVLGAGLTGLLLGVTIECSRRGRGR